MPNWKLDMGTEIGLFLALAIAGPVLYLAVNAKLAVSCGLVALLVVFGMAGDYLNWSVR